MDGEHRLGDVGRHHLGEYLPASQDHVPSGMTVGSLVLAVQLWSKEPVARLGRAEPIQRFTLPRPVKRCQAGYQWTNLLRRHCCSSR